MENLRLFFNSIHRLTFWQRIFSWAPLRALSYKASEEFRLLENKFYQANEKIQQQSGELAAHQNRLSNQEGQLQILGKEASRYEFQFAQMQETINRQGQQIADLNEELVRRETLEEDMNLNYQKNILQLNQVKENLETERKKIIDDRFQEAEEKQLLLQRQWQDHELSVKQSIRLICQAHAINYVEQVPFQGNPDNTIEIGNEFYVFDAKSPAGDDLTNFPKYLKAQAEAAKKYVSQDKVRKDIFLVVPGNTLTAISQFTLHLGAFTVYILPKESLEPVILYLKKLDEFEFAKDLDPEERENICRIIGRFVHTTKRRLQVDQFFAGQLLDLLSKCSSELPTDIYEQVNEFERVEKLNPPPEKRAREISLRSLQEKNREINLEFSLREIPGGPAFDEAGMNQQD